MTAKRTFVEPVAVESVARAKPLDPGDDLPLLGLEPRDLGLLLGQRA